MGSGVRGSAPVCVSRGLAPDWDPALTVGEQGVWGAGPISHGEQRSVPRLAPQRANAKDFCSEGSWAGHAGHGQLPWSPLCWAWAPFPPATLCGLVL